MATLSVQLQHKRVEETQKGELYRVPINGTYATCITIETEQGSKPLIGILDSPKVKNPTYLIFDRSTHCLSFGMDFVIEPIFGPESFPGNMHFEDDQRILFVQSDDALLRFDRLHEPNSFDCFFGSLRGQGRPNRNQDAVPFRRWNIWLSAEDRARAGAIPIVEFGKEQKPAP